MSALSKVLRDTEGGGLTFECPGCNMWHGVMIGDGPGPRWGWNGNVDKPTFTPSIVVQFDKRSEAAREQARAFHEQHGRYPTFEEVPADQRHVCHSFVTDGRIQFLGDCTHVLAGQTVDLPEIDP